MPSARSARWYTWLRPAEASRGVGDLGAISTSRSGLEIAPRSLTPSEAALGRIHVYQRAERAEGISLAPGIVPKGQSRRARRPAAHRHQPPPGAPKPTSGGFWRGLTRQYRANRVVPQAVPHPYMMHMLGRGQWVRQGRPACGAMPELVANTPLRRLVGERIHLIGHPRTPVSTATDPGGAPPELFPE